MPWKRSIVLAAAIILVNALILVGCNEIKPSDVTQLSAEANPDVDIETIPITFWTPFSGGDEKFMTDLVNRFNIENKDHIHVDLKNIKWEDFYTKLPTAIVTDEAPDVTIIHSSKYDQYIPADFLVSIDEYATSSGVDWNDFNQNILEHTISENQHYGIPLDTHFLVMFYNKHWLSQAGLLDDQEQPLLGNGEEAFIQFLETLKKHIPANIAPLAVPYIRYDSLWLWWSLYSQMNTNGGDMYTSDGRMSNINNADALKSLKFVNSLYKEKLIPPNMLDSYKDFSEGKAAVMFLGIWVSGALENIPALDYGVTHIPQIYDHPGTWGDSHVFAFPKKSHQNPQKLTAAIKFATWIAQNGAYWAKAGHIPAVTKVLSSPEFMSLPYRPELVQFSREVNYFPNHPQHWKITDLIKTEMEKMLIGRQTPEEALQEMHKLMNNVLKEQGL
jgi:multiple sugar transport system substrate-binding protein